VALLCLALVLGAVVWIRGRMQGVDESIELREALEQRFGPSEDFVPWDDGAIPAERMERFLEVREATMPQRRAIASFFEMLPRDPAEVEQLESGSFLEKLGFVLRLGRAGVGMAEHVAEFLRTRNAELERVGMGPGEYTYVYVSAYYAGLGHSPADDVERAREAPQGRDASGPWQAAEARRDYLAQLRNLRERLGGAESARADWGERLAAEIEALEADPRRVPWQDGLPEPIRASIEPYRERLEATYSPLTNPLELGQGETRGMSIRID
jgi:hypothetical protein